MSEEYRYFTHVVEDAMDFVLCDLPVSIDYNIVEIMVNREGKGVVLKWVMIVTMNEGFDITAIHTNIQNNVLTGELRRFPCVLQLNHANKHIMWSCMTQCL